MVCHGNRNFPPSQHTLTQCFTVRALNTESESFELNRIKMTRVSEKTQKCKIDEIFSPLWCCLSWKQKPLLSQKMLLFCLYLDGVTFLSFSLWGVCAHLSIPLSLPLRFLSVAEWAVGLRERCCFLGSRRWTFQVSNYSFGLMSGSTAASVPPVPSSLHPPVLGFQKPFVINRCKGDGTCGKKI